MPKRYNRYVGHYQDDTLLDIISENIIEASRSLSSLYTDSALDIIKLEQKDILFASDTSDSSITFTTKSVLDDEENTELELKVYPSEGSLSIGTQQIFTAVGGKVVKSGIRLEDTEPVDNNFIMILDDQEPVVGDVVFDHWTYKDKDEEYIYTDNPVTITALKNFELIAHYKTVVEEGKETEENVDENI